MHNIFYNLYYIILIVLFNYVNEYSEKIMHYSKKNPIRFNFKNNMNKKTLTFTTFQILFWGPEKWVSFSICYTDTCQQSTLVWWELKQRYEGPHGRGASVLNSLPVVNQQKWREREKVRRRDRKIQRLRKLETELCGKKIHKPLSWNEIQELRDA